MTETMPRYDAYKLASPPSAITFDEKCLGPGPAHEFEPDDSGYYQPTYKGDREIVSQRRYLCSPCVREMLLTHYRKCPSNDLAEPAFEFYPNEVCSDCGYRGCKCL